ncbi:hypothetical protein BV25DRAFT_1801080, partial [Artomyces pyxidatus]
SKANFMGLLPFVTGGSWKKSPVTTTYADILLRKMHPICASLSKRSPSIIDTVEFSGW